MAASDLAIILSAKNEASAVLRAVGHDVDGLQGKLQGFASHLASVGAGLTVGLTLPLAAVAKQALDTGIEYQAALNMMQAVSGATAEQMAAISETAKALGADMTLPATSAGDAAAAMVELAKGGLSVEDAMNAAKGALQLSAAGQIENAEAAKIVAQALNTFHLEGSEAVRIADLLAAGANASAADVRDLAVGFQQAGFAFSATGQNAEDLVAALGILTNVGLTGSDAGTALKNAMIRLISPTDEAKKLMAELGVNVYDAAGNMLPFREIVEVLGTALGPLTQEQRNAALETIFLSDGMKAMIPILDAGVVGWDAMLASVTQQGAAADLAAARMAGLGGAMEGLKSQVETALLILAEPVMGTLEGWARALAELVPKVTELDPALLAAGGAFLVVLAVAGPVLAATGAIAAAIAFLISPIGLAVLAIALLAAAFASDFLGIRTVTEEIGGAVVAWFQEQWPLIQDTVTDVMQQVQLVVETVLAVLVPWITEQMGSVVAWVTENWPLISQTAQTVFDFVLFVIQSNLALIQAVIATFKAAWETDWAGMATILTVAWEIMGTILTTAFQNFASLLTLSMQVINGDWAGAWTTFQGVITNTWNAVQTVVTTGVNALIVLINKLLQAWNGIQLQLPTAEIPGVGTVGGGSLGVPQIPLLPTLQGPAPLGASAVTAPGGGEVASQGGVNVHNYFQGPVYPGGSQEVAEAIMDTALERGLDTSYVTGGA
jgi:TP901 family phage tail tape measure protein